MSMYAIFKSSMNGGCNLHKIPGSNEGPWAEMLTTLFKN